MLELWNASFKYRVAVENSFKSRLQVMAVHFSEFAELGPTFLFAMLCHVANYELVTQVGHNGPS